MREKTIHVTCYGSKAPDVSTAGRLLFAGPRSELSGSTARYLQLNYMGP